MKLPVVPAGAEPAGFYREIIEALRALAQPLAPAPLWSCHSAALPSPSTYVGCLLRVSDLDVLAHSNGAAWIRADTGDAI